MRTQLGMTMRRDGCRRRRPSSGAVRWVRGGVVGSPDLASCEVAARRVARRADPPVHARNYGVHGAHEVLLALNREGVAVARCTVERLMRHVGVRGTTRITVAGQHARAGGSGAAPIHHRSGDRLRVSTPPGVPTGSGKVYSRSSSTPTPAASWAGAPPTSMRAAFMHSYRHYRRPHRTARSHHATTTRRPDRAHHRVRNRQGDDDVPADQCRGVRTIRARDFGN